MTDIVPAESLSAARPIGSSQVRRRTLLRSAGGLAALGALAPALSACGGASDDANAIRFESMKSETAPYFEQLINDFNASQKTVTASHDSTSNLVAGFVRGTPPDLDCDNFDVQTALFITRGVLNDLGDLPEAGRVRDDIKELAAQYGSYRGQTSVLPYSITAAGVIYNADLFAKYNVKVPTTWSEVIKACETFKANNITPIYATYKDTWTVQQGLFDYVAGGLVDSAKFFTALKAEGADVSSSSSTSFTKTFTPAVEKMQKLRQYLNPDAASRSYDDGNAAFAAGKVAMYFQGPWAFTGIDTLSPKFDVRTFPLPVTEDPADTLVRVNLDLACWIPRSSQKAAAAKTLLSFLFQDSVINKYNQDNLAFSPLKNAPEVTDNRLAGLRSYVAAGKFYQGAGGYIPLTIPARSYIQGFFISGNGPELLNKLDTDWARLARRTET